MEQLPVIVLIDIENSKIHLFGKYITILDFDKYFLLEMFLKDEKVLYINDLVETNYDEVLELIGQNFTPVKNNFYLRAKENGFTTIAKSKLVLYGPKLPKKIEDYKILENKHLQELIKTGKVEIIGEDEANKSKKIAKQSEVREEPSIIIDQSIKSVKEGGLKIVEEEEMDEIGEDTKVVQEAQQIIDDIGLKE